MPRWQILFFSAAALCACDEIKAKAGVGPDARVRTLRDAGLDGGNRNNEAGQEDAALSDGGDAGTAPPSPQGMVQTACAVGVCPASRVVEYWKRSWNRAAVQRTVLLTESSDTLYNMVVTDGAGQPARLDFESGLPAIVTVRNPGDDRASTKHTFTAPPFFRTVAWWKAETADAEYRAPTFDSFDLPNTFGKNNEVKLFFVPTSTGTFDTYCAIGVPNGQRYPEIAAGKVQPDLNDRRGHAGLGMKGAITVRGSLGIRVDQEIEPGRRRALERDPRRNDSNPVWGVDSMAHPIYNRQYLDTAVVLKEVSDTMYTIVPDNLSLTRDQGAALALKNPKENSSPHSFVTGDLYLRSVLRRAVDSNVEIRASYLRVVLVHNDATADHAAQLWIVPTSTGTYTSFCDIAVQRNRAGAPDLMTGHAGLGMRGTVTVVSPPPQPPDGGPGD